MSMQRDGCGVLRQFHLGSDVRCDTGNHFVQHNGKRKRVDFLRHARALIRLGRHPNQLHQQVHDNSE